jgi:hypothetical protein
MAAEKAVRATTARPARRRKKTLAVEISYSLEAQNIHFDLLLLFTEDSIKRLTHKINYLMS